jgi:hypothetical protein
MNILKEIKLKIGKFLFFLSMIISHPIKISISAQKVNIWAVKEREKISKKGPAKNYINEKGSVISMQFS